MSTRRRRPRRRRAPGTGIGDRPREADPWGYREAWIDAFAKRRIYPGSVTTLSEDSLRWSAPSRDLPPIKELSFNNLRFKGDPGRPVGAGELRKQAEALGRYVSNPEWLDDFGLAVPGDAVSTPCIEWIRSSRRVGPDGQIAFDLVGEVTQKRTVATPEGSFDFYGGSTIILGPEGEIRYLIRKTVTQEERLAEQQKYVSGPGRPFWRSREGKLVPAEKLFHLLHRG